MCGQESRVWPNLFALSELPREYDRRGLITSRPVPWLLHLTTRKEFEAGECSLDEVLSCSTECLEESDCAMESATTALRNVRESSEELLDATATLSEDQKDRIRSRWSLGEANPSSRSEDPCNFRPLETFLVVFG